MNRSSYWSNISLNYYVRHIYNIIYISYNVSDLKDAIENIKYLLRSQAL